MFAEDQCYEWSKDQETIVPLSFEKLEKDTITQVHHEEQQQHIGVTAGQFVRTATKDVFRGVDWGQQGMTVA